MSNDDLNWIPAVELARMIHDKEVRAKDVAEAVIARIENVNPALNAYVYFDPASICAEAAALDARQDAGEALGPLHGVPYSIKDMTDVAGLPTTDGLKPLKDNIASKDAVVVTRLKNAGGLFLGKTNLPEMAYYGGTDNHLFGPTHNPWKHGYTAGGSSGGAAAAVAAGLGQLAEGTDGAGSIRIPSAMCGVVGLKPTTGVIPAPLPFLDWAYHGPITRTVGDNALMLDALAGYASAITPSVPRVEASYLQAMSADVRGLRVAWSPDLALGVHVDPEVIAAAYQMVETLRDLGAHVTEGAPDWPNPSEAMWYGIWVPAFSGLLAGIDMDTNPQDFDEQVRQIKIEARNNNLAAWGKSFVTRTELLASWDAFMADYDILVSPTLASAAFPLDQFAPSWLQGASLREQLLDWLLTYPFNMLNNPALTIPAGFTPDGRPVGFQIAARHWQDARVLGIGRALEQARPWADRRPNVQTG